MNHDVTQGLDLLADEAEPAPVDITVIAGRAKARSSGRRASTATAVATVAVVVTIAVTLNNDDGRSDRFATATTSSQATPGTATVRDCEARPKECRSPDSPEKPPPDDKISQRLNTQVQAALGQLIPAQYTLEADPNHAQRGVLDFQREDNPNGHRMYTAYALVRGAEGVAGLQIWVMKNPAGTALTHFDGQVFGPCMTPGVDNCEARTFDDGTSATAQANARPSALQLSSTMTAQRPDGTYIQMISSVADIYGPQKMPTAPFTNDDMFTFATAFDWDGVAAGPAKYDGQLEAAGGLPGRYTITSPTDIVTFAEAPDGSDKPRYFVQLTLHRDGKSTSFDIFISPKPASGEHPGTCKDGVTGCTVHRLDDGTSAAVEISEDADGVVARLSAVRPDNTVIEVEHFGEKNANLMTSDELLKLATAFTY